MTDDTLEQLSLNKPLGPEAEPNVEGDEDTKKLHEDFKKRIDVCKQYRRKLVQNWVSNIDYRRGKPFASQTDEDRIAVNLDWTLTKSKQASLFSQVPQVRVDHAPQTNQAGPWLHLFEQRLNDTLVTAGIETAMDEVLPDVINAAGIGAVLVSYEAIQVPKEVPVQDLSMLPPEQAQQVMASKVMPDGTPLQMESVPQIVDRKYSITRISPADLLWPINFTGADFDHAPWIGHSGKCSWPEAQRRFGLEDADKEKVVGGGGGDKSVVDKLTHDIDKDKVATDDEVSFDQVFYKEYQYSPKATNYNQVRRLVYVEGKDDAVIDEEWKGQKMDPAMNLVTGSTKCPIRVLTLTYITDETIPPSDTAIGRPQVNEINKSRTQMILQRERSLPVRWFNVDRIDTMIQQSLMRGTWQGMIPVQGDGSRSIGEVARGAFPQEDFEFDRIAKSDLNESWQVGPNQLSSFGQGRHSASEANITETNFQTRIGRERAKVAKFFVSIAEVLGGLLCLFEDPTSFGQGFDPALSRTLAYSILADSTVLVDSQQRLTRLINFVNFAAKSGWIEIGEVLKEIATLSGLDPNVVVRPPQPAPPAEPNISLRLTGVEDMLNPLTLATLMKSGQAPTPDLIEQAKKLIQLAVTPPLGQQPGMATPPGMPGPNIQQTPAPPDAMHIQPPMPPPPGVGDAHPDLTLMSKIDKRSDQGDHQ
jgi:hypothetical protein